MNPQEIEDYYLKAFNALGRCLDLTPMILFPVDPPEMENFPATGTEKEYVINRAANALFRLAYSDLIFCPGNNHYYDKQDPKLDKEYSLIHCMELILHQHNPLYVEKIFSSWCFHEAWITDEGERFYEENKDNLLEAITKRFEDYGVGFEKGNILKVPE